VEQLVSAKDLFCEAASHDLIPHSKELLDSSKASLVSCFEGRIAGSSIKDVTNPCIFNAYEKPGFMNYECKCGLIDASLSSYYATPEPEVRAEEVEIMFPRQGGADSASRICGTRVKDSGIEEVPRLQV
jgi:hypothetical protein